MASEVEETEVPVKVMTKQAPRISKTTIFVRNLPYTTTDADFKSAFEDVGPIKRCFIVKDKDNQSQCRGFGYVTFALEEDAQKAKETVKNLKGRAITVSFSEKKARLKPRKGIEDDSEERGENITPNDEKSDEHELKQERETIPHKDPKKAKSKSLRNQAQSDEGRTVIITGLPTSVTEKQIYKRCRKLGEVEKTTYPVEGRDLSTAAVLFKSYKDSRQAASKLNGKILKGSTVTAVIQTKEKINESSKGSRKSRLIVRNLSFRCTEAILRETFGTFGEINDVQVPAKKVGNRNRKLGFGFVQFTNVFEAAKALEGLNTKEILGRPVAVDWAVAKAMYKSTDNNDNLLEGSSQKKSSDNGEGDDVEDDMDKENGKDDHNDDDDDDDNDDGNDKDDDDDENKKDDDDDEKEDDSDYDEEEEEKKRKPSDVKEGLTVFIRNLSFDSTEKAVTNLFRQFGNLAYCKVVIDAMTQHSKGTAFVKFKSAESVSQCLTAASQESEAGLSLDGNRLHVDLAVTRGKLEHLHQQRQQERKEPRDKRNLYLAREGVILPGSEPAADLSKGDLTKRQKAEAEKKSKLKNPNCFVSKTRLCVRNLPLKINEKELTNVFSKAGSSEDNKPAIVKSVLLMRNKERIDSSGKGRPLGFGFVEFTNHKDALAAIRATNNSPSVFGPDRRPIVEFSIENSLALKAKQQRVQRNKQTHRQVETQSAQIENAAKTNKEQRQDKKEHRIEQRKAKRLRKKERNQNKSDAITAENNSQESQPKDFSKKPKSKPTLPAKPQRKQFKKDRPDKFNLDKPRKWSADVVGIPEKRNAPDKAAVFAPRQKAKRKATEQKEETAFNSIVQNYKNKLFGDSDAAASKAKRARWFE